MLKHLQLITEQEAADITNIVLSLKSSFKSYANNKFSILGAASYANSSKEYSSIIKDTNPILIDNFKNLFNKIKSFLETNLGKECFFDKNLSYPGFHIFHGNHQDALLPLTSLHIDTPYELHKDYLIKNYEKINFDFPLTLTLALKLPKSGAGLYYWDNQGWEMQKEEESYSFYSEIYKKYINIFKNETPYIKDYKKALEPKYLKYIEGNIVFFKGNLLHQIAPFFDPIEKDEIRITLQAHGVECNNKWLIYF
jgi:hypothetical protein